MKKKYLFLLLFLPLLSFGQDSSYYAEDGKIIKEVRQHATIGPLPQYVQYEPGTLGPKSMYISEAKPGIFLVQLTGTGTDKFLGIFLMSDYKKTYILKMNNGGTVSLLSKPVFTSTFAGETIMVLIFYLGILVITVWVGKKNDMLFHFGINREAAFPYFYFICLVFFISVLTAGALLLWSNRGANPIVPGGLSVIIGTFSIIRFISSFKKAKKEYEEQEMRRHRTPVSYIEM